MTQASKTVTFLAAVLVAGALAGPAGACDIPVFRFALERWLPDPYEVVVFHRGPLEGQAAGVLAEFRKYVEDKPALANCWIDTADLAGKVDAVRQELYEAGGKPNTPWVALLPPERFRAKPTDRLWAGPLDKDALQALIASPFRSRIGQRIAAGDSAVWVLLESGDKAKDDAAATLIDKQLRLAEKELVLPEPAAPMFAEDPEAPPPPPRPALKLKLSLLRLSRKDPAEQLFIRTLLRIEPELSQPKLASEPMAFPLFGRGRVLCGLAGKGINETNVLDVCAFLCGPCSCMVKDMNPGMDLLFSVDWDKAVGETRLTDMALAPPPLMGLPPAETGTAGPAELPRPPKAQGGPVGPGAATPRAGAPARSAGQLMRNILIAVGALVVLAGVVTALMLRRPRSDSVRS